MILALVKRMAWKGQVPLTMGLGQLAASRMQGKCRLTAMRAGSCCRAGRAGNTAYFLSRPPASKATRGSAMTANVGTARKRAWRSTHTAAAATRRCCGCVTWSTPTAACCWCRWATWQHRRALLLRVLAWAQRPCAPLLRLVPHDSSSRIVHVEARTPGKLLLVRVAVDQRGDPAGRYEMEVLRVSWGSAMQHWAEANSADDRGLQGSDGICQQASRSLVTAHQHAAVNLPSAQRHGVLQVVAWDEQDNSVTLSYSSLALPPVLATVRLLPCCEPSASAGVSASGGAGVAARAGAPGAPAAAAASHGAASPAGKGPDTSVVELECGKGDPWVVTERLWATSHDGAQVPITLCRPVRCSRGDGSSTPSTQSPPSPLLLQVYGAYGMDPSLDYQASLQPLLRRGVAVAVAHVRGGSLLGPAWYEGGRGAHKANSHRDLLAAAAHLVACGVTEPQLMCVEAESAGGWAVGPALAVAGTDLFRAAVLTVPTLDVMTSLLQDPSYGPYELGDPRVDAKLYRSIMEWSPYDGLSGSRPGPPFPALFVRVGLYDTKVPYWDPAKYMARLRSLGHGRTDPTLLVMQVKLGGHEAYDSVKEDAARCAFVLWAVGAWPEGNTDAARDLGEGMPWRLPS
ncbi:hypothetical protein Agub_g13012 [Astrephomene gubernaculifera]|uniref:Prolyl endopeptidase n=1 Tax=Astrephomene gubernaculifera TaxID=47775 RepID=A0AAD3E3L3_9CHLO|nr:hypothetical protein Agub_g13012 [Astrephomene gubernaculifera]